jgi:hypothetical protein
MFLTEEDHNLVNTVRYLVGKNLTVNQTKLSKFAKLALKMKDEVNKDILLDIKEKSENNKTNAKVKFLKDMVGISNSDFFNKTLGMTFSLNMTILLIAILIIMMSRNMLISSLTIILLNVYYLVYKAYKYRSLIFVKEGAINTTQIIKLYNNSSILDKIVPIALIPNYRKLYIKNMAESKMVKILEDKMIGKDEIKEWTNWMQLPSKIANMYEVLIKIMKIIAVILVIIIFLRIQTNIKGKIETVKNVITKGKNMMRDLTEMKETIVYLKAMNTRLQDNIVEMKENMKNRIKEQVDDKIEKLKVMNTHLQTKINEMKNITQNKIEEVKQESVNQLKAIVPRVQVGAEKIKSKLDRLLNTTNLKVMENTFKETIKEKGNYITDRIKKAWKIKSSSSE